MQISAKPRYRVPWARFLLLAVLLLAAGLLALVLIRVEVHGADQLERSHPAAWLSAGQPVSQVLRVTDEQLLGIQLWLIPDVRPSNHMVRVSLWEDQQLLAEASRPASALNLHGPSFFPLQVATRSSGVAPRRRDLLLQIEAPDLPPGERIVVMAGTNRYPNSALLVGQRLLTRVDLSFELVYQRALLDRLWPQLGGLALGKPGPLAHPGLFPLLLLLYLILSLSTGIALWRALPAKKRRSRP